MKIFKKIVLIILLIFFIILGSIFILGKGLEKTILKESFYKELIKRADISSLLVEGIIEDLKKSAEEEEKEFPEEMKEAFREAFTEALDKEWVEETLFFVVKDSLAFVKGEKEDLFIVVDLTERKMVLQEAMAREMEKRFPVGMVLGDEALDNIPDEVILTDFLKDTEYVKEVDSAALLVQKTYRYFDLAFYFLTVIFALLFFALAGFFGGLKWMSFGVIFLGITGFLKVFFIEKDFLLSIFGLDITSIGAQNLIFFFDSLFIELSKIYLIFILVGVLLLLIAIFGKKLKK